MKSRTLSRLLCLLLLSGLSPSQLVHSQQAILQGVYTEAQAARGAEHYDTHCSSCHAADLRGNSNSPSLMGMSFMFIWDSRNLGDLLETIRETMPSDRPGSLPVADYVDIIAFILQKNNYPAGSMALPSENTVLREIVIIPQND